MVMNGPVVYYPLVEMYGAKLDSITKAKELCEYILDEIDAGLNVELDFKEIEAASKTWVDNSLKHIVKNKGADFFQNHIRIINDSRNVRNSLKRNLGESFCKT